MREWERQTWAAGQTESEVIRRVGKAVAEKALAMTDEGALVVILAGKGHNGDDARLAREHLQTRKVELLDVTDPASQMEHLKSLLAQSPALVIDGLFGIGINRQLSTQWVDFIDTLNATGARILSVDVPSGLDAETGKPQGTAVRAHRTLTVGAPKKGMLNSTAWEHVGLLDVTGDVGLVPCPVKSEIMWTCACDFQNFPPRRTAAGHKGTYGHVGIIAGSTGFHGAAVLAAGGAQRAQPGLITLHALQNIYHPVAAQLQAVMVSPWNKAIEDLEKYTGILIGPGLAGKDLPDTAKALASELWIKSDSAMVVDASALGWLPQGATKTKAARLITPHPGEAARLLGRDAKTVQADRVRSLRELSKKFGKCWVVLKGHQTLVGRSSGPVFVNSTGNPHLGQGGSGDLLSGYLAGLLAQPPLQNDPERTIRYAVWQHGAAADWLQARRANWTVEDLGPLLGDVAMPTGSRRHSRLETCGTRSS
jgi:NAD(P)H-hydrate epimerase